MGTYFGMHRYYEESVKKRMVRTRQVGLKKGEVSNILSPLFDQVKPIRLLSI